MILGNPSQLGIRGMIRDLSSAVLRVFSKQARVGLVIEAEILPLLEGLLQAKALGFPTLTVSTIVIS